MSANEKKGYVDVSVFIADGARLAGDNIRIGRESSVWYNTVLRCDEESCIMIGERTNIQDLSMIHGDHFNPVSIGDDVTIGHMCLIHGCEIGSNTLIGMGSIIMDGAVIGSNCLIGAGSLVTEGKVIPDGSIAFGRPAKVIKELTPEQIDNIRKNAIIYVEEAREKLREAL